jgi:hypothetical protein
MSAVEEECRASIVLAYGLWRLRQPPGRPLLNLLAYAWATGVGCMVVEVAVVMLDTLIELLIYLTCLGLVLGIVGYLLLAL